MNAIITAATGYTEADLQIFLWSVARNCQDTVVFLIVYRRDRESIEKLQSKYPFVRPIYIGASIRKQFSRLANYRTRPYYSWLAHQLSKKDYSSIIPVLRPLGQFSTRIIHERFFIALKIIKTYCNSFSNVLLTDCRDVVIQRDPFSLINGKLVSGCEPVSIENEQYTLNWIKEVYGDEVFDRVSNNPVVCAGVTLGPVKQVETYLTEICNEMWRHLPQMSFKSWGYDQSAHIYLIFEKQISLSLTNNQQGLIATVSLECPSNIFIDLQSRLVKVHNNYPAIIHQYDRHPNLLSFFEETSEFHDRTLQKTN